jgi:protein-disulfide isomerase
MKKIIWIIIAILVVAGLFFLFTQGGSGSDSKLYKAGIPNALDNTKGNASSTVVLMEYSDFQCPACRAYYPVMRQLMQEFGDRVQFVYRHFPLTGIHANAEFAARAAQAAANQGKFWEMHDILFEKQEEWAEKGDAPKYFESYAKLIGLDVDQFNRDFRSKQVKDFVASQRIHALSSGLQGTPSFYLNGQKIDNPNSADAFRTLVLKALQK